MSYNDKARQREYMRKWIADRRASYLADKSCRLCGSVKDLQLDHIDPTQKISHRVWSWRFERREAELAKCQVLCRSCHKDKTAKDQGWVTGHGTMADYKRGCRCELCRTVHSGAAKSWRQRVDYMHTRSDRHHGSIAQRQSNRPLTEGLGVRAALDSPIGS